ncbi:MAG: hypothetical protein ACRC2O_03230 [Chitinophagaceae bacterium]
MRKAFIIILSLQILSSGQFLNELLKFRNLFEHYQEHQQNGSIIDFAGFIQLHYFDTRHEGTDPKNHDSLPLHQANVFMNFVFQTPVEVLTISYPSFNSEISYFTEYSDFLPQYNCAAIFQPPKYTA